MAISVDRNTKVTIPLVAVVGLVGLGWGGYEVNDRYASKDHVANEISIQAAKVDARITGLESNVNELVAATVVAELIDNYLRYKCENPGSSRFDGALQAELVKYKNLTGRDYDMTFKTCEVLLER